MITSALRILVATPNIDLYNKITSLLNRHGYSLIIYSGDVNTTIKLALNEKISLIILDTKQNVPVGTQSLYELLYDLNITKRIPIITMAQRKETVLFKNYGITNSYTFDCLLEKVEEIFAHKNPYFDSNEEIEHFISSLVIALESKDAYSRNHSARVAKYASLIAEDMGKNKEFISDVNVAGLFHDLGKIGVPDRVLLKPGRLNDDEFNIIKQHPAQSERICAPIKVFDRLLPIIRGHHERFDGTGYPDRIRGEEIPEAARIIAIADAFDALTSNRAYRKAFDLDKVLDILYSNSGKQWDKEIMKLFLDKFDQARLTRLLKQNSVDIFSKSENLIEGTIFDTTVREQNDEDKSKEKIS